ncbi:MAG TPA: twin-arginine translocase TatA/TatE family subunit [Acidimicrobiales bacterium]|nr:twin-arginine translocase TatA/TatE family subunit [Acidimicrobiales bacterium]
MGGLLSGKLLFLLFVALIVLGPERLPDAARTAGRLLNEFRRVTGGLQEEVRDAFAASDLAGPVQELKAVRDELRSTATGLVTAPFAATMAPGQAGPTSPAGASGTEQPSPPVTAPTRATAGLWSGDLSLPPGDPGLN